jgi:hypothetical protein
MIALISHQFPVEAVLAVGGSRDNEDGRGLEEREG